MSVPTLIKHEPMHRRDRGTAILVPFNMPSVTDLRADIDSPSRNGESPYLTAFVVYSCKAIARIL